MSAFAENFKLIDWTDFKPSAMPPRPVFARSHLPGPMIIRDDMEPTQSMATGKMYTSKSAIRAEYKALQLTEVGNDSSVLNPKPAPPPRSRVKRKEIEAAVGRAFSKAGMGA